MKIQRPSIILGLVLTLSSALAFRNASPAQAQALAIFSDVSGNNITTSTQSTSSGTLVIVANYVRPEIQTAVNNVASTLSADSLSGSQTVGSRAGIPQTFRVDPPQSSILYNLLTSTYPVPTTISGLTTRIQLDTTGTLTIASGRVASFMLSNPAAGAFLGNLLNVPVPTSTADLTATATAIESINQTNPAIIANAVALSVALNGMILPGQDVSATKLTAAVDAYNKLVTALTAANAPTGALSNALPLLRASQAALGKMVDAAYAAR